MALIPTIWMQHGENQARVNECDKAEWESQGWEVCDAPEVVAPEAEILPENEVAPSDYDFQPHRVGELRAFAEAAGIEDSDALKKAELVEALVRVGFVPGQGQHVPDGSVED